MDTTVGKWRWVRKEASLLDGDLLLCFNGVVSVAAVIRRRASLPRWSSCALACLGVSSEMRQPSQAQQHHQNALLQTRLIFSLLRASFREEHRAALSLGSCTYLAIQACILIQHLRTLSVEQPLAP
jgi:hypothetical protein